MNIPIVPSTVSIPLPLRKQAFSLVEVVVALGVIGFALTTLIGLMPVGLNIFRESMTATVQTDVLRQLASQFQETPFAALTNSPKMLYFSDQSTLVTNAADALLGVSYTFTSNTSLLSSNGYANSNLKTAVILLYTRADRAKSPQTASITNVLYVAPGVH